MVKILLVTGVSIFGILGTLHLLYTFFTRKFHSSDPAVMEAMRRCSPVITNETSMWKMWVGFNASHSIGAMLLAAIYIPLAVYHFPMLRSSVWFMTLPVVVAFAYLLLARRYWFRVPYFGVLIALVCFVAAASLVFF